MAEQRQEHPKHHTGLWVLVTLGAAAGAAGGWLWARTRRDKLVAQAGAAVHAEDVSAPKPDDASSASAGAEPDAE